MNLNFVNLKGEPVSIAPVKVAKKTKEAPSEYHKGWVVLGYSPEVIEAGRLRRLKEIADSKLSSTPPPPPFTVDGFMRETKPKRAGKFVIYDAALTAAAMLERQERWIGVTVQAMAKGLK